MKMIQSISMTLCYACVAVAALSGMIPQKRTKRIMSFVIGIFFIGTLISAVSTQWKELDLDPPDLTSVSVTKYDEGSYRDAVAQQTADHLTVSLNELLQNDGINAKDIKLSIKISDEGRISVVRAVIYISERDRDLTEKIKSIIYRNISKEPEVYVQGEVQ